MELAHGEDACGLQDEVQSGVHGARSAEAARRRRALIMAPSLGLRCSGINATMEALLPVMDRSIAVACCGWNLSKAMPAIGLLSWLLSANRHRWRIWHARRNNDMLLGLLLRYVLRQKLILVWTSAAQRQHTWLTRFCYCRMDAVLATTAKAAAFLQCQSEVSHHGVNVQNYHPTGDKATVRQQVGLPNRRTLGVFGRIRPQKGTGDLVEALLQVMHQHEDWQVVFVGQATAQFIPYRDGLIQRLEAARLGDRVRFTGFLEGFSQLPQWFQAMDAVACVSRNEGFGVTCLEAMASGVPVLATQAGAWPEIVDDGIDGWIVDSQDSGGLAAALRRAMAANDDDLDSMGQRAREKVRAKFRIEHESARLIALYDRLLRRYGESSSTE
jgi:mannosyltransferase